MGSSLDALFGRIATARDDLDFHEGEECFYRGHANTDWPLAPTLLRKADELRWKDRKLRDVEADLFWEFEARARELHDRALGDWDILIYMREHGVATRLLDWSETLGVALWFALNPSDGSEPTSPCVWLMNPYQLNKHSWELRDLLAPRFFDDYGDLMDGSHGAFEWDDPVAIYPMQRNQRQHVQRGYFTIHGNNRAPLESLGKGIVRAVPIHEDEIAPIKAFLAHAGLDELALFPDLDALARSLNRKSFRKPLR